MLESHPALHYALILVFYIIGVFLNILIAAHLSARSNLNGIRSIGHYLQVNAVPIGVRFFLCLCMFLTLYENNSVMNLERFMPTFSAHLGVSGGLGYLSDNVWDKFIGIFVPGLKRELPPIPEADPPKVELPLNKS